MKPLLILITLLTTLHAQKTDDATLVKQLLAEDLGTRTFSLAQVIQTSSGKKCIPFNPTNKTHLAIQKIITTSTEKTITSLNQPNSPTKNLPRINEASRHFENKLLELINAHPDFTCTIPKNNQGRPQRSGYPDLLITHTPTKTHTYLDPKLLAKSSKNSSLRTFYFEPRTRTLKIQHDALHLLIGITHDEKDGDHTFLNAELIDLSTIAVRLKAEFQTNNKTLYKSPIPK